MKSIRKYTKNIVLPITGKYNHRKYIHFYYPTIHWDSNVVETIISSLIFCKISSNRIFKIYKNTKRNQKKNYRCLIYYCIDKNSNIKNHVVNKTIQKYITN